MKNIKPKFKPKVKITDRVKALIASMLSAVLTDFAPTTGDNTPRKGRYLPPKTTGVIT
jgi:hypothetical protein